MLQSQNVFAAMIPDVDLITKQNVQSFPPNMDLQNDGETYAAFSYAVYVKNTQKKYFIQSIYEL